MGLFPVCAAVWYVFTDLLLFFCFSLQNLFKDPWLATSLLSGIVSHVRRKCLYGPGTWAQSGGVGGRRSDSDGRLTFQAEPLGVFLTAPAPSLSLLRLKASYLGSRGMFGSLHLELICTTGEGLRDYVSPLGFASLCQTRSRLWAKTASRLFFLNKHPHLLPVPWQKLDVRGLAKAACGPWPDSWKQGTIAFPFDGCYPLWILLSESCRKRCLFSASCVIIN